MQDLEKLLEEKERITNLVLKEISDRRGSQEIIDVSMELFEKFPECNGLVLMASYKTEEGDRVVYSFDEIEGSKNEGYYYEELGEYLVTINNWISENSPGAWRKDKEVDALFEKLASLSPYPIEEEFDWNSMNLGQRFEMLLLKNGEYV